MDAQAFAQKVRRGATDLLAAGSVRRLLTIPADWNTRTFTWVRGPVVTSNTKYETTTSSESRNVTLSSGETGTIDMPTTSVIGEHEFWIKGPNGEIHVWLRRDYVSVYRGQTVTLIYYGNTFVAYIVHDSREEMIVEAGVSQVTGRPGLFMTLAQTFFIFPICFVLPWAIIDQVGLAILPHFIARYTFTPIMMLIYFSMALFCFVWLMIAYPVRYVLYVMRANILRPKIRGQIAALRSYSRAN